MKVSLLAQVLVVALCLIGSQVSAQTLTATPSSGTSYLPITGVTDICPSDTSRVCLTFTVPINSPSYTSYQIQLVSNSGGTSNVIVTTNSAILNTTVLTPGITYTAFVYGLTATGIRGPSSQGLSITLPAVKPQGTNPFRIHNVLCQVNNLNFTCTWSSGKKNSPKSVFSSPVITLTSITMQLLSSPV